MNQSVSAFFGEAETLLVHDDDALIAGV